MRKENSTKRTKVFPGKLFRLSGKRLLFGKRPDVFREHQRSFFRVNAIGRDTRVCPESHTYTIEIQRTQTNKQKRVQRRLYRCSRWLRLFGQRFTINILIINIMTSNFGIHCDQGPPLWVSGPGFTEFTILCTILFHRFVTQANGQGIF